MGFRFWRRIKVAPGVTLNLSKSGASVSFGPRGAKLTVGPSGARATAGIPGTGLFYTRKLGKDGRSPADETAPLDPGFFARLLIPAEEEALIDGCRALALGDEPAALERLRSAAEVPDAAFLAGCLAVKLDRLEDAERLLARAAETPGRLGSTLERYGIEAGVRLDVTDEVSAFVTPTPEGVTVARIEVYQEQGRVAEALDLVETLHERFPDDLVVSLSLAELLSERDRVGSTTARRIVSLTEGVENGTPVHTAALLYRARALRTLGLAKAARDTCTRALRRKKGRSEDLLLALRYERALAYRDLGQSKRYRDDLEGLCAIDSDYEDVAERLGLESPPDGHVRI